MVAKRALNHDLSTTLCNVGTSCPHICWRNGAGTHEITFINHNRAIPKNLAELRPYYALAGYSAVTPPAGVETVVLPAPLTSTAA